MSKVWRLFEATMHIILEVPLRLSGRRYSDEQWQVIMQFLKFGLVGASNALVVYVTYSMFVYMGLPYLIGNLFAFIISVLNSFYWNNKYVFVEGDISRRNTVVTLVRTFIAYGTTGIILNSILLIVWIDVLQISQYVAPIINLIITTPLNFVINKFWSYKIEEQKEG